MMNYIGLFEVESSRFIDIIIILILIELSFKF